MAAAILYPDLSVIPQLAPLGNRISDGAYVAIGLKTMPVGMIGLMVSAIFAATTSSMDTGLNKNAGIFIRNFYKPVLRKQASEKEYLLAGKITTFVFGLLVICAAIFIQNIQQFGLFDIMMLFSSMVAIPFIIPLIWGIIIKRTPKWSAWSTVIVGFLVSIYTNYYLDPDVVRKLIGLNTPFRSNELDEYLFFSSLLLNVIISSIWFIGSSYFARYNKKAYSVQEEEFFKRMNNPVITNEEDTKVMDKKQLQTLSRLSIPYGGFVMLLSLIPNAFNGRMCFVFVGGLIFGIGLLLKRKAKKYEISL